jgi:hypothetical protein
MGSYSFKGDTISGNGYVLKRSCYCLFNFIAASAFNFSAIMPYLLEGSHAYALAFEH